jgi:hypothetical protein
MPTRRAAGMPLKPCLRCGNLTNAGSYCQAHR